MSKGLSAAKAKKILEDGKVRGKALTEKQKKFFGAVAGGATPLKKLNGGWLDKFDNGGVQPNYNDSNVSLPPGFKGYGYDKGGRAYNGAWDGPVTKMGGTIPGATGMMYARTSGLEPLEPTKAQDGEKIKRLKRSAISETREFVRESTNVGMPKIPSKADLKELAYRAEQERLSRIPTISQDNRTPEQRKQANEYADKVNNASLSLLERPLVYLANPLKLLGDVLDPVIENTPTLTRNPFPTSKEDAIKAAQITYRPNTSLSDRLTEKLDMGVDYVPEATLNTALGLATAPRMTVGSVANEILNPVAGLENTVVNKPSSSFVEAAVDPGVRQTLKNLNDELGIVNTASAQIRASEKFNKNWFNNPETVRRVEQMINQPTSVRSNMSETEILQDLNLYETMLDKSPNLTAAQKAGIERQMKDLYAGVAKKNLQTVQQKGRFTEVLDPDNIRHQEMDLYYDENPKTIGVYKGRTNQ